jgi:hypothetical protein
LSGKHVDETERRTILVTAGQLFDVWSAGSSAKGSHLVLFGPHVDPITDAELHLIVDVYRDDQSEEIIVHHADEPLQLDESGQLPNGSDTTRGLTLDSFLTKLKSAMGDNPDWPLEGSAKSPSPDDAAVEADALIRIDFPIGFAGGIDDSEILLLLW